MWSEGMIARALALQFFQRKYLCVVPNCNFTGYECDMLCVTENLRIIDVEIKISRADLKADAKKDKWWHKGFVGYAPGPGGGQRAEYSSTPLEWPRKVWKHYYAMPADIWRDDLVDFLPSDSSGILLLREGNSPGRIDVECYRRSKPCKDAQKISPEQAVNVARLASLRMWDQIAIAEGNREMAEYWREKTLSNKEAS